ncbi:hemolysin D [Altererythrobacter sp. B11]|uniref:efflux RND transporter periplasmic adaptor subunit n=1 Tax=Altererythrobacter sp. B11 TaxID=2060312 RepID=UPI000DC72428|nr:efflux RND transporter periplasmic adaptor subunit [Altererythrobacter sp. B11]BBC72028.1 hemolysin D [Altererythrobacter sp. B11]
MRRDWQWREPLRASAGLNARFALAFVRSFDRRSSIFRKLSHCLIRFPSLDPLVRLGAALRAINLRTSSAFAAGPLVLALSACSGGDQPPARPAPEVGYVVAKASAVPIPVSLSGRTVAYETSEVRPQVTGIIRRRLFEEGGLVRAGQPLYQIDDRLFVAAVNQAEANLASAKATAEAAEARAKRYRPLAEIEAVAQQDYTDAQAQAREAQAAVAQASAALQTARVNLAFTKVAAPISGRIGRSLQTIGALASANQAEPLAIIQRLDPIFVDMQESSSNMVALQQALAKGRLQPGSTSVRLKLEDGGEYPYRGTVQFSEVTVDQSTGTVTLRARFPNPDGLLLPGMFVTATFEQAVQPSAILVPQPAVQRDFDGSAFVYIVDAENKAKRRKVSAERTQGTDWVITSGLKTGDKVITQAPSTLRQDTEVRAVPQDTPQRVGAPQGAKPG